MAKERVNVMEGGVWSLSIAAFRRLDRVCGGKRVWRLRTIGGAVKEGEGCKVAVDGEDFSEEVGGVDEAGKEDKTEELLAGTLPEPVETHVCLSTWTSSA